MPDDNDARRWVVDPPGAGEILFQITAGEGAELTAQQEAAVDELMRTLAAGEAEVTGLAAAKPCPHLVVCSNKTCPPLSCGVLKCNLTSSGLTGISIMGSFGPA
jgi:hypothetical protein